MPRSVMHFKGSVLLQYSGTTRKIKSIFYLMDEERKYLTFFWLRQFVKVQSLTQLKMMVADPLLKVPCHTDCKTSNKKQESSNTVMIITAWWTKWTKAVLQAPCLGLLQDVVRASILRRTLADFHKDNRSTGTFSGRGVCACMQG